MVKNQKYVDIECICKDFLVFCTLYSLFISARLVKHKLIYLYTLHTNKISLTCNNFSQDTFFKGTLSKYKLYCFHRLQAYFSLQKLVFSLHYSFSIVNKSGLCFAIRLLRKWFVYGMETFSQLHCYCDDLFLRLVHTQRNSLRKLLHNNSSAGIRVLQDLAVS